MAEEKWVGIKENQPLHKGDIVKLDFMLMSLFDWDLWYGIQMDLIEKRLDKDPRFTLLSTTYPEESQVTFKVRVDENPVTVLTIIAILSIGITIFLSFIGAQLLVKQVGSSAGGITEVTKEAGWTAVRIGLAVLLGMVGFIWLKKT